MCSISACSKSDTQEAHKTAEEYKEDLTAIQDEIEAKNEKTRTVDLEDAEVLNTYCEDMKSLYQQMIGLEPSEGAEDAQQRITDGAQKMIEYLDGLPAYMALEDEESDEAVELRLELLDLYSGALAAIAEGTVSIDQIATEESVDN